MLSNSLIELDLIHPVTSYRGHEAAGSGYYRAWKNGLIIRAFPTGVLGYAPPLCCSESDIEAIVERTAMILDETLADADVRIALQQK